MIKAKSKMIEPTSEAAASEVFVVADNIIPVRVASVDAILNTEFTEEMQVVPEKQVQQLIVENKTTNPLSGFFVKMSGYLDSMENFLTEMHSNYTNAIEQKKSIYQTEETDQDHRTHRSKSTARKLSDQRRSNLPRPFSDLGDDIIGLIALNTLGGGVDNMMGGGEIQIVPYTPVAGQLVAKGKTDPTKGDKGYVSGYPLTSLYGWRWGRMHGGVDIGVPIGTKFALKEDAVIKFVGWQDPNDAAKGYGLLVDAWVPSLKKMFRFGHLSSVAVKDGETVKAGSVLGASGNTGLSTGPHFHIEVHSQVTSAYGGDDPMPYIDYVIAGEDVQQRSEGSIERVGRVMVGEAGTEFVIPMSQMPIFAQLMMEEKIKSLNPFYVSRFGIMDGLGVERQSGFTNTMMSAGAILATEEKIKKYEGLGAYTPGTGRGGRLADYITVDGQESIISGTPRSVAFNPNTRLYSYIDSDGYPTIGWGSTFYGDIFSGGKGTEVRDGDTTTVGRANQLFKSHVRQLYDGYNETYPLWKHFTDKQVAGLLSYYYNRGVNVGLTLGIHKRALRSGDMRTLADDIEKDIVSVGPARRKAEADLIRSGPSKIVGPGIVGSEVGPKEVGTGIPFFPDLTIINAIKGLFQGNKSKTKKPRTPPVMSPEEERNQRLRNSMDASEFFGTREYRLDQIPGRVDLQSSNRLNSIPGNEQMQIANETQEQFSFDNSKGQIVAFYQPTVYYTEA